MKYTIIKIMLTLMITVSASLAAEEPLYEDLEDVANPTWNYIVDNNLIPIEQTSTAGITGSTIDVNQNHALISSSPYANRAIQDNIAIHTLGNATVSRSNFHKWSRWYQEDENTQIFRLFKDEINVRNTVWYKPRIEAELRDHVTGSTVKNGADYAEWSGTYTVLAPILCTIFQIWGSSGDDIPLMLHIEDGRLMYNPRATGWVTMLDNVVGTSFDIKVRDYGHKYELYLNGDLFATRNYTRTGDNVGGHFRWGCYHSGDAVVQDFKMFITGAQRTYSNDLPPQPAPTYGNGGTPGTGEAWPITRSATTRIEAENYDQGDSDVVYSDTTPDNTGGEYRTDDVDIGGTPDAGGGYNVGWASAGEWLQYTIDVERTGLYEVTFRHARSPTGSSALRLSTQGAYITDEIEADSTGDWDGYSTVTETVELQAGEQALRLHFVDGSININWIEITPIASPVITMDILGSMKPWDAGPTWSDGNPAHTQADYVVPATGDLISPTVTATFPGYSLTVEAGGKFQVRSVESDNEIITVDSLIFEGGTSYDAGEFAELSAGSGSYETNVLDGTIKNTGTMRILSFEKVNGNPYHRSMKILSEISGTGHIQAWEGLDGLGGDNVIIDNASNTFSGTWETGTGSTLIFANAGSVGAADIKVLDTGKLKILGNWQSEGTLTVADTTTAQVDLGSNAWNVSNLVFGGAAVADGVYSANELNAMGSNPVFSGIGTLRVGAGNLYSPLAYWPMDEGSGTVAIDASGNGHTGTLENGVIWGSDEFRSSYASFDGEDDRIATDVLVDITSVSKNFTWAYWVKNQQNATDGDQKNAVIVGNRYPAFEAELHFMKHTPTKQEVRVGGTDQGLDYEDLPVGEWHHCAVVKSGTTLTYYRDGAEVATHSLTAYAPAAFPFFIGGDPGGNENEHFNGFIDDVVLYDSALTADDISHMMVEKIVPPVPPTLEVISSTNGGPMGFGWTNGTFKLQYRTNLTEGAWEDMPGGGTPPVTNSTTAPNAFFRLIEK